MSCNVFYHDCCIVIFYCTKSSLVILCMNIFVSIFVTTLDEETILEKQLTPVIGSRVAAVIIAICKSRLTMAERFW